MPVTSITASGDYRIDALLGPMQWLAAAPLQLSFSFADAASLWTQTPGGYDASSGSLEPWTGFRSLAPEERDAVRAALQTWAAVADLRFVEVADSQTGHGTIRFAWTAAGPDEQSHTYEVVDSDKAGDVWLNADAPWEDGFTAGSYGLSTLIHEIGHAIGLAHPFEGPAPLPLAEEGYANSLMSYTAYAGSPGSWVDFEPSTPMLYDILAIQHLYGANTTHRTGDDTYVYQEGQSYFETIWDAGGTDAIVWEGATQGGLIDLRAGAYSQLGDALTFWSADFSTSWLDASNVAIAFGVQIENATGGSAADRLIGNDSSNRLEGRGGNDLIQGGAGDDLLVGGQGDDRLDGGAGVDVALYSGDTGLFQVNVTASDVTVSGPQGNDLLVGVERLVFDGLALALDLDGAAGAAYRLYCAAFAREPDLPGLGYWIDAFDLGAASLDAATGFLGSAEFAQLYGPAPDNDEYLRALYLNVLEREPDAAGVAYWAPLLDDGLTTREQMLVDFADSTENRENMVELVGSTIEYSPWQG